MKQKFLLACMESAEAFAKCSTADKLKVGCVIVKDDTIVAIGWNGTPAGWDNKCEVEGEDGRLVTLPEVLHAEANAIAKLARGINSGKDATLIVTHQPCMNCAKLIYQAGITDVYYKNARDKVEGLEFLKKAGIPTTQLGELT